MLLAAVGILLNIAGDERKPQRAAVPDRGRRDSRARPAVARSRGSAARPRRQRDVRRVAGSGRGAGSFPRRATSSTRSRSPASRAGRRRRSLRVAAARRPRAARVRAILTRRRPDVVLGGGGYVAGPMVYAAWRQQDPAALTEADAHLGLANRLAAPFARRVFLAYPIPGRDGAKYRVTGRPVPARTIAASRRRRAARRFGLPAEAPVLAFFGALAGRAQPQRARRRRLRRRGPGGAAHLGRARLRAPARPRCTRTTTCSSRRPTSSAPRSPRPISRSRARAARSGSSPRPGTPAILVPYPHATADHQTQNARYFERGGGAVVVPEAELDRVPALVDELLADPARLEAMRAAMRSMARPRGRRRDRGGADRACAPLDGPARSGSSASAAPGCRPTRSSRAPGAPRSAGGTGSRRRTCAALDGHRGRDRARAGRAGRVGGRRLERRTRSVAGTPRAELLAELVSLRRAIVVAGAHGKTTTAAMIAFVPRRARSRPGVARRRRDPAARRQRRRGGGLARRRGRRVGPHGRARCGPRSRVVTNVELDHHSTFASRGRGRGDVRRAGSRTCRRSCAAGSSSRSSFELAVPGRAQPAERRGGARRARARRRRAGRRRAGARALPRRRTALRARRREERRHGLRRLRATTRPRSRRPSPRRASASAGRVLVLFQPHLYSRTRHLAHELGAALVGRRRGLRHRDLPRARAAGRGRRRQARRRRARARACARAGRRRSRTAPGSSRPGRGPATSS